MLFDFFGELFEALANGHILNHRVHILEC